MAWDPVNVRTFPIYDYSKHLASLDTISILIMISFLDKLLKQAEWLFLVGLSLIAFVVSVVLCLATATIAMTWLRRDERGYEDLVAVSSLLLAWFGFFIGILSLVILVIKNLY